MQIGIVVGMATATRKHASMDGHKLLVVQAMLSDGMSADGDPLVAVDGVGAGVGERVLITSDGTGARELLQVDSTPVRWTIVGIADS
jgi:ethanolamine utilization protein EutN